MKQFLLNLKTAITTVLLALPMLAIGQDQTDSNLFEYVGKDASKLYMTACPDKMFIMKEPDVSKDYIISLLNELTDSQFETSWHEEDHICRIIIDDDKIDDLIEKLLKDDAVLVARRIYAEKADYETLIENQTLDIHYLHYPYSQTIEKYILNTINPVPINQAVFIKNGVANKELIDSICNAIGLTIDTHGVFIVPKTADIFDVQHKLFNTGYFEYAHPETLTPFRVYDGSTKIKSANPDAPETIYYNLSGHNVAAPSGLTIVVKRYSDGTVRTEKKLFIER